MSPDLLGLPGIELLVRCDLGLLLDLVQVQMRDGGLVAINDLGQLLERGALGLNVHEVNKTELKTHPALFACVSCVLQVQSVVGVQAGQAKLTV